MHTNFKWVTIALINLKNKIIGRFASCEVEV